MTARLILVMVVAAVNSFLILCLQAVVRAIRSELHELHELRHRLERAER